MGDRTTCTLWLSATAAENLRDTIAALYCEPDEAQHGCLIFNEVNYGYLPQELAQALDEQKIDFIWFWQDGGGYPPGMEIHCDGEIAEWNCNRDGDIILTVDEIKDPVMVTSALEWDEICSRIIQSAIPPETEPPA
jgi:hypothetical protein